MIAHAHVKPSDGGWKVEVEKYYGTLFTYGPFRWRWVAHLLAWWLSGNY